jgi:hypothetical protein
MNGFPTCFNSEIQTSLKRKAMITIIEVNSVLCWLIATHFGEAPMGTGWM